MNTNTRIVSLVKNLLDNALSLNELKELQQYFRSVECEQEVDIWLKDLWESSDSHKTPIDLEYIRQQLDQKIRQQSKIDTTGRYHKPKVRFVYTVMRYAAVFIFTTVLSWYWFRPKHTECVPGAGAIIKSTGVNVISVTYGSKTRIVLPDSSIVYLNSGSRLSYPSVFDKVRRVDLLGEGYFIVQSDSLHPFLVHTSDVCVKALGTEFNVKAYPEEQLVETMLVKGSIEILKKNQNPIIELKPGEKATYLKRSVSNQANVGAEQPRMEVALELMPDVSMGWVENHLIFDAEPFEQIAIKLERWFNVKIDIRNASLLSARLSGKYDTENIEQVMRSLQMTTPFSYKIEKNRIIIK